MIPLAVMCNTIPLFVMCIILGGFMTLWRGRALKAEKELCKLKKDSKRVNV